ncbi:D-arabinono-1,4-lactone oxidase [Dyadobacter sandarakinus]|uniref:FAD-binding protein n=2 Tax=Dyadobacter sandarakinus TaxID=2747268 RepID=A0ABX7IC56_9BACT|nr:FAD-binding protein [Dyadobacter sandarakinus]
MKKRTFIKLTSALMSAPLLSPLTSWAVAGKLKNWAGNLEYSTERLDAVSSQAEVQQALKKYERLKVLGTRHCFNDIADTKDQFISLVNAEEQISIDEKKKTVTVNAGIKYGRLSPYLDKKGFALHNLASLPHISVAGACITATHGSGEKNGNLATAVSALEMVTADGSVVQLSREKDGERFKASVVNLGALGVITKVTLDLQPAFQMRQYVYENLPLSQLSAHFDEIQNAGYSVSLFTNWATDDIAEIWIKQKLNSSAVPKVLPQTEFFGARLATRDMHPIPELSAENCTPQMGVPGPWYERMPHFKMGFTPSSGVELQSEYFVPRKHAVDAIMAVARLGRQVSPHLLTSEIRTIAADDLWLSPCYKQDSVAIHFTWKQEWDAVSKLLPVIEKELAPFGVRPHWGKLFSVSGTALAAQYEQLEAFRQIAREYDPKGKFRNAFLDRNVFA